LKIREERYVTIKEERETAKKQSKVWRNKERWERGRIINERIRTENS
jgi:hypothetical protein